MSLRAGEIEEIGLVLRGSLEARKRARVGHLERRDDVVSEPIAGVSVGGVTSILSVGYSVGFGVSRNGRLRCV